MGNKCLPLVILLVLLGTPLGESGSIFFYMNSGSKSHWHTWKPFVFALAKKGHDITLFSPFREKEMDKYPNIDFTQTHEISNAVNSTSIFMGEHSLSDASKMRDAFLEVRNEAEKLRDIQSMLFH